MLVDFSQTVQLWKILSFDQHFLSALIEYYIYQRLETRSHIQQNSWSNVKSGLIDADVGLEHVNTNS